LFGGKTPFFSPHRSWPILRPSAWVSSCPTRPWLPYPASHFFLSTVHLFPTEPFFFRNVLSPPSPPRRCLCSLVETAPLSRPRQASGDPGWYRTVVFGLSRPVFPCFLFSFVAEISRRLKTSGIFPFFFFYSFPLPSSVGSFSVNQLVTEFAGPPLLQFVLPLAVFCGAVVGGFFRHGPPLFLLDTDETSPFARWTCFSD